MKRNWPIITIGTIALLICGTLRADDPAEPAAEPIDVGTAEPDQSQSLQAPAIPQPIESNAAESSESVDTEVDSEPKTNDDHKPTIVVRGFGRIVHIGPDGRLEIKEFGSDPNDPSLERVQQWLNGKLNEAKSDDAENGDDGDAKDPPSRRRGLMGLSRILRLGKDGRFAELDNLIDLEGLLGGDIEIQGLGGGHHIKIDGDLNPEELARSVEETLKQLGVDSDGHVIGAELDKAMRRMRQNLVPPLRSRSENLDDKPRETDNNTLDSIASKLDDILKRLDKVEADVNDLKRRTAL